MEHRNKINIGDLVRLADKPPEVADLKFKILNSEHRALHSVLKPQAGVVLSERSRASNEDRGSGGVYNVAFGNIIIVAYQDYFEKVEKSLNKK